MATPQPPSESLKEKWMKELESGEFRRAMGFHGHRLSDDGQSSREGAKSSSRFTILESLLYYVDTAGQLAVGFSSSAQCAPFHERRDGKVGACIAAGAKCTTP
ncbi:unnamed protein product [Toxocara canis]|uniref:PH domain-containing protein n=1 Tax=Toxocara canis TaxID=6265 RepID=A0A183UIJ4_TOXCA|nr:unnamed protein product [Toxocara canis]